MSTKRPKTDKAVKPAVSDSAYETAGASLLAEQANSITVKSVSAEKTQQWQILQGHLEGRLNNLRAWRVSWWNTNWSDLAQYIEPSRSTWLTQTTGSYPSPNNMSRGRPVNNAIVDPTATIAVRVCANGLMSGLASPSRPWFKIMPSIKGFQLDQAGREYLDEVEDRIYTILAGSNFYNSFAVECLDLVVFGTAPVLIYEDDKDIIRCYNPAVGEYFLSSGATMRVDSLYRTFVQTIAQMVDFFKLENCPPDVQKLWAEKGTALDQERIVAHSIEPNFELDDSGTGKIKGNFTWREVYWVVGGGGTYPLSMRGFVDQPFTAPRWMTQSNDAYGRSVGMDVLPDVVQLQVMTLRMAEGIEKHVRPPLLADITLKNQPSSSLPGHVTYVANLGTGGGMRSIYDVNPDISAMAQNIEKISARIKQGFFNDLFLMLEQGVKGMTATEVQAKLGEKAQVLGPVIENIITDSLKPRLKRVFKIIQRRNMLPLVPDSMKGVPLDVQFISALAQMQKASVTAGIERITGLVGNLAAVFPQARDMLNVDEIIKEMNSDLGNPNKILNSDEVVQQMRQQAAAAAQKAQAQAALGHAAQTASVGADAAQTLANTQVGSGATALSSLLSGSGTVQ